VAQKWIQIFHVMPQTFACHTLVFVVKALQFRYGWLFFCYCLHVPTNIYLVMCDDSAFCVLWPTSTV